MSEENKELKELNEEELENVTGGQRYYIVLNQPLKNYTPKIGKKYMYKNTVCTVEDCYMHQMGNGYLVEILIELIADDGSFKKTINSEEFDELPEVL